ncbi:MAG: MBOAT family protein, partial [Pseudomonadota bacterium]
MLFTELTFWAFFAVVAALYIVFPHRLQNRMLLVASYVFYAAWDWRFLSLIILSTMIDYFVGLKMEQTNEKSSRSILLSISLTANLGMLAVFKYFGFFIQ